MVKSAAMGKKTSATFVNLVTMSMTTIQVVLHAVKENTTIDNYKFPAIVAKTALPVDTVLRLALTMWKIAINVNQESILK